MAQMYDTNLDKNDANFTPLSPLSFLIRAAEVYPNRTSIIHGKKQFTWSETYKRANNLRAHFLKEV